MADSAQFADGPLATATRQVDSERIIVTEWRFPPGGRTGWHKHAYEYVVVPMTTGDLLIDAGGDPARSRLVAGQSHRRDPGAEHDVINDNPTEFVFIEIEFKP